eukprot:6816599-Alexandrium_andersonii.AAC.1
MSQSQHTKCSAILLCLPSCCPRAKCPLSQRGIRPDGNEVMTKSVSARSASAARSDAEIAVAHGARREI